MPRKKGNLLLLTDLTNGSEQEDVLIASYLQEHFHVWLAHPDDSELLEDIGDGILIRNTWNDADYGKPVSDVRERFLEKGLKVHDDLYIPEGNTKDYLISFYRQGYPVIPTVGKVEDLETLPIAEQYVVKPHDGFNALGLKKVSKQELAAWRPKNHIIQPSIDFEYEISFYYLDKQLEYTLYAPDKNHRWDLKPFVPSQQDLTFAKEFIASNKQRYGIERIDACRLRNGELLLMEITDQGGAYLSLLNLDEATRELFLEHLVQSIRHNIFNS